MLLYDIINNHGASNGDAVALGIRFTPFPLTYCRWPFSASASLYSGACQFLGGVYLGESSPFSVAGATQRRQDE